MCETVESIGWEGVAGDEMDRFRKHLSRESSARDLLGLLGSLVIVPALATDAAAHELLSAALELRLGGKPRTETARRSCIFLDRKARVKRYGRSLLVTGVSMRRARDDVAYADCPTDNHEPRNVMFSGSSRTSATFLACFSEASRGVVSARPLCYAHYATARPSAGS